MYRSEKWQLVVNDEKDVNESDLITLTEAANGLGVSTQTIDHHVRRLRLKVITQPGAVTAHKRPRRWLLRSEFENLRDDVLSRRT